MAAGAELAGHDLPPARSQALMQARLADASLPVGGPELALAQGGVVEEQVGVCAAAEVARERWSSSCAASLVQAELGRCCPGRRWCRRRPGRRSGRRRAGRCVRCRRSCRGRWRPAAAPALVQAAAGSCRPGRRWCRRRRGRRPGRRRAGRCVRCRRSCPGRWRSSCRASPRAGCSWVMPPWPSVV